jgi:hypothetical protein
MLLASFQNTVLPIYFNSLKVLNGIGGNTETNTWRVLHYEVENQICYCAYELLFLMAWSY